MQTAVLNSDGQCPSLTAVGRTMAKDDCPAADDCDEEDNDDDYDDCDGDDDDDYYCRPVEDIIVSEPNWGEPLLR